MHPHPTLRITAVVTASCQDARRAKRKFTPILLVIIKFFCGSRELVTEVAYPSMCRRGVSVISFVGERWVVIASRLDVRVRLRPIDSRRRLRPSSKLENISTVMRWCCRLAPRSSNSSRRTRYTAHHLYPSWSGWLGCSFILASFFLETSALAWLRHPLPV